MSRSQTNVMVKESSKFLATGLKSTRRCILAFGGRQMIPKVFVLESNLLSTNYRSKSAVWLSKRLTLVCKEKLLACIFNFVLKKCQGAKKKATRQPLWFSGFIVCFCFATTTS